MQLNLLKTPLDGLKILEVEAFGDERGFFMESWSRRDFERAGLNFDFIQDSHSRSTKGVLRGLHYQDMNAAMTKLVRCTAGSVFDVAVDLRVESKTFGKWFGIELSAQNKKQILVPIGFAHGFEVMSDNAEVQYKQTAYYASETEGTIMWNDQDVGISWPIKDPILSARDKMGKTLREYSKKPAFK